MSILKNYLVFAISGLGLASAIAGSESPAPPAPAPNPAATAAGTPTGGKIQFATPVHDFGRAKSGDQVRYTYIFTNTDPSQVLEIRGVQPQCGCTTAGDFTKKVDPGQTGLIPIQFNSTHYNGPVLKMITVTTSDHSQPVIMLQLKGTIWQPIEVSPLYAIINVPPDVQSNSSTVRIINNLEEPVQLSPPESNNRSFVADLKTTRPGKEFALTVSTVGQLPPGNVSGQISIKTDSTNFPVVNVIAMANVQPALLISPSQINLPPAPLMAPTTNIVTIQNNGSTQLQLSDPAVSSKDVTVEIKEAKPGKVFLALVSFPQGFETPPGQPITITMKSNHPQYPLIKVPIMQQPHFPVPPHQLPPPQPHAAAVPGSSPLPPPIPVKMPLPQPTATQ